MSAAGCPCGSGRAYAACCEPLHRGTPAASAEALMRSRYSAYVRGDRDYLLRSWHASTRPAQLDPDAATRWLGLTVKRHVPDGARAEVEFVAWFRRADPPRSSGAQPKPVRAPAPASLRAGTVSHEHRVCGGSAVRLHERSRFVHEDGHWYYLDGEHPP